MEYLTKPKILGRYLIPIRFIQIPFIPRGEGDGLMLGATWRGADWWGHHDPGSGKCLEPGGSIKLNHFEEA